MEFELGPDEGRAGGTKNPPPGVVPRFMVPWLPTEGVALNKYPGGVVPNVLLAGVEGPLKNKGLTEAGDELRLCCAYCCCCCCVWVGVVPVA